MTKMNQSVVIEQSTKKCKMRFLIAIVVLACATGAYSAPEPNPEPAGPGVILPPKEPTLSPGDINGAAIEIAAEQEDAQVVAVDFQRAAFDAANQVNDHVVEVQRQQIDAADDQAWKTVDNIKTIEARSDGALASAARVLARQYVIQNGIQPVPRLPVAGVYGDQRYAAPYVAQRYGALPGAYAPGLFGAGIAPLPAIPTVLPTPVAPVVAPRFASTVAPIIAAEPGSLASASDVSSSVSIPDEAPEDILKTSDAKTSSSSAGSGQGYAGSGQGYTSSLSTTQQAPVPTAQSIPAVGQGYSAQVAPGYSAQVAPNPIYDGYNGYNYNFNGLHNAGYFPQTYTAPYYSAPYPQYYQDPYYGSPYYKFGQTPYTPYARAPFY